MPRIIPCADESPLELGDVIEALNCDRFDPADEDSFAAAAPLLKGLGNNPTFLTDIAVKELKDHCSYQTRENRYSSQVIMIHRASSKYFLRANFWPSAQDSVMRSSGTSPFFYHVPHDHNFSFLTVGYLGPGYWSDYYEYEYEDVVGFVGEKVDLRFTGRSRLDQGKVMLYRAHRDVHNQLPADEMSVSLNIMESSPTQPFLSQYRFDVDRGEVAGIMTNTSAEALLDIAAHFGDGNARDLLESFARHHPCDRMQFNALRALAGAESDLSGKIEMMRRGTSVSNRFVSAMSGYSIARMEEGRPWIECAVN
ncbi:MAG TPA: transposase [Allosphingosinicella sp.]